MGSRSSKMSLRRRAGSSRAPASLRCFSFLVYLALGATASHRHLLQQDDPDVAPVIIDESSCVTFTADEYNPLRNANGSIVGFMTVRSSGATSVSREEMLEVSLQLRDSSGLYLAKAPAADAAGNVVAVSSRYLPDACPMVDHVTATEAATADCAARKTKLDFAVPLPLFNCSAYVLDDFNRAFFLQLRVYVSTQPCGPPTDVIYVGPAVNALDGQPGCTYASITGGCRPSTCPGWNTDLAAQQAAAVAVAKGTPTASTLAHSAASSASAQEQQWKTIVPAVVGAAVGALLVAAIVGFVLLRSNNMFGGKRRRKPGARGGRRTKRAGGDGADGGADSGAEGDYADALQPSGYYDEDMMAAQSPHGMDLGDEQALKAGRGSAAPHDYDSGAAGGGGGGGRMDSAFMSSATHARTLGLGLGLGVGGSGGSQTFWGLSGHWLRSPRFGGLGASVTGGEMARLRPQGGLDSAAASPNAPASPGVHFVRMRAHGLDDTVSRSAALLPLPYDRPRMAAGAAAAAAHSGAASPGLSGRDARPPRGFVAPYFPGGTGPDSARGVSTAPNSPGQVAFAGSTAARMAAAGRTAAASMATYAAANAPMDSQRGRREQEAHGELVSLNSPPLPRYEGIPGGGMGPASAPPAPGGTSRLAHETRPMPPREPSATAAVAAHASRQCQHRMSSPGHSDLGSELQWSDLALRGAAGTRGSAPVAFYYNDAGQSRTGSPPLVSPATAPRAGGGGPAAAAGLRHGMYVHADSYNSPQIYSRSAAAAAAGTAVAVPAESITQGHSPPLQPGHYTPAAGLLSTGGSGLAMAPHSPLGWPTGAGNGNDTVEYPGFTGLGPLPGPSSAGGRCANSPRAGGAMALAGRQRAATDTGDGMLPFRQPLDARTSASGIPTGGARGAWTALWGGGGDAKATGTSGDAGASAGWVLPPSCNASAEPQVHIMVESAVAAAAPAPPSPGRSRWQGAGARAAPPSRLGRVQQPLEPAATGALYGSSLDGSPGRPMMGTAPQVAVVLDDEGGGSAGNSPNESGVRGRVAAALRARSGRQAGVESAPRRSAPGLGFLDELGTSMPTVAITLHGPEGPSATGGGLLSRIVRAVGGIRSPAQAQGEVGLNLIGSANGGVGSAGNTGSRRSLFQRSPQSSEEEKQA